MPNTRRTWMLYAWCAGLLAAAPALHAQVYGAPLPTSSPRRGPSPSPRASSYDGPAHVLTTNPLALLAGWFSAEFEQRANPSVGVVVGLSYYDFDDQRSTSGEAKVRLYPLEHATSGFNMGSSIGFSILHYRPKTGSDCGFDFGFSRCGADSGSFHDVTAPTFGVEVGNQWMFGANRRTAISVGIGAKRYLVSRDEMPGKDRLTGTLRFGVGYGF